MTRLEHVIEQVKEARKGNNRPWIFDDKGMIKDEVFCGEVLELLEEVKPYEIEMTDEEIANIVRDNNESGNTYNWNANISNNINWNRKDNILIVMVHLYGDIRVGYSDYFALDMDTDDLYSFVSNLNSYMQPKDIPGTHMTADIDLFSEGYNVYDYNKQEDIGELFDLELSDLLESLKEV